MVVNMRMAKEKNLSAKTIKEIEELHEERDRLEKRMLSLNPKIWKDTLLFILKSWRKNEYKLQDLWGFRRNKNWHAEFTVPHCTCPTMDNHDKLGTSERWISEGCIYHGRK